MNAQTQISAAPQMNSVGLLNLEAFELSQRVAKMLSSSTLVPEQYRAFLKVKAGKDNNGQWVYQDVENPNGLSNCVIALNMANRMGADPLMIMQNLYLIEGRPSWSSQFIMASINSCGRFSALRFEIEDLGEKEVEYQETTWTRGSKQTTTKKIKIQNITCVAWVIERESGERLESSKISIEMAVKEGWYQKNGSKWQTMPEQMLRYRAASFFGRVYAPELLMGLRSAEEEQDRIIDVTPQEQAVKADYSQLKREILGVKSPAELNALEELVFDIPEEAPRKELIKLVQAQAKKFKPAADAVSDQNPTSNDVAENTVSVEKPEPVAEQAPPAEEPAQEKKPRAQSKKAVIQEDEEKYQTLLADLIERTKTAKTANEVSALVKYTNAWSADQRAPLHDAINKRLAELKEKDSASTQEAPAVNEIKSNGILNGLKLSIEKAENLDVLKEVAQTIRDSKPNLTVDHMGEVLQVYGARKTFLENQQDMFAEVSDVTWTDKAIADIAAAKNQDEINFIFTDPQYEEQSDPDQQRITNAAQQRESELFGN